MYGPTEKGPQPATKIGVDELRMQLRSLGYLDAGVDRFVLGAASDTRRPLAIAALGSLRIGMLAAVLLGPAAAVGIGTRFPGLVTGTSDAVVVALYLALLFGAAATIVSFLASLIVARLPISWIGRRARVISRGAGVLVGGACLAYLTLWWRIANPDLASLSAAWTAAALVVEVAISLLLGHASAITAFAVIVASAPAVSAGDAATVNLEADTGCRTPRIRSGSGASVDDSTGAGRPGSRAEPGCRLSGRPRPRHCDRWT